MKKASFWTLVVMATLAVLSGVVDWLIGLPTPHTYWLVGIGAVILVGLGIWEGCTRKFVHPFLSFLGMLMAAGYVQAASSLDEVLSPPEKIPRMVSPVGMTGEDLWLAALVGIGAALIYTVVCDWFRRRPCQPWRKI
jgi:hypothetical protein